MASIKAVLYKSKTYSNGEYPVMIRVNHHKLKYIGLGISAKENQWNKKTGRLKTNKNNHVRLNNLVESKRLLLENRFIELEKSGKPYKIEDIISVLDKGEGKSSFNSYTKNIIQQMKSAGQLGNAAVYQTMLNRVNAYIDDTEVSFEEITYKWLKDFESFCTKEGVTTNGISVYMRTLRAVFNRAIQEKQVSADLYPFNEYKIKNKKPLKRAISKEDIVEIRNLKLEEDSPEWHARNFFLFSFYTLGISWVDMAHLKLKNIKNKRINYKRAKTGKDYSIELIKPAQEIVDWYKKDKKDDDYIFPIIHRPDDPDKARLDIKNELKQYNKYLRKVGDQAEIGAHLTSYVSRHSWASLAFRGGVNIGVISKGLGHDDIKTTQIYLEELGAEEVDKANLTITDLDG